MNEEIVQKHLKVHKAMGQVQISNGWDKISTDLNFHKIHSIYFFTILKLQKIHTHFASKSDKPSLFLLLYELVGCLLFIYSLKVEKYNRRIEKNKRKMNCLP